MSLTGVTFMPVTGFKCQSKAAGAIISRCYIKAKAESSKVLRTVTKDIFSCKDTS